MLEIYSGLGNSFRDSTQQTALPKVDTKMLSHKALTSTQSSQSKVNDNDQLSPSKQKTLDTVSIQIHNLDIDELSEQARSPSPFRKKDYGYIYKKKTDARHDNRHDNKHGDKRGGERSDRRGGERCGGERSDFLNDRPGERDVVGKRDDVKREEKRDKRKKEG